MTVVAIECKRCGGALPVPGGGSPFVTCSYCGTCHAVSAPALVLSQQERGPSASDLRNAAAQKAWDAALASSPDPIVALRAVVAELAHDLRTEQELERAARLAEALGTGFDQQNGTHAVAEWTAAKRLAEASVKAVIELKSCPQTQVNLPFLAVGPAGPVHLERDVTGATLAELDAMGVYVVKVVAAAKPAAAAPEVVAAPPPSEVVAAPPAKKRWWPFG